MKFGPSHFQAECYGDSSSLWGLSSLRVCFLPFPCTLGSPLTRDSHGPLFSQTEFLFFLTSLMWPLLYLYLWSLFCQSSSHFLSYFHSCDSYLMIPVGWRGLTVPLFHRLLGLYLCTDFLCLLLWFWIKVYILLYKYCYPCCLLVSCCMKYHFPSLQSEPMCVLKAIVRLLKTAYKLILFFKSFQASVPLDWRIHPIFFYSSSW